MHGKKGISPFIAFIFILLISMASVVLVMRSWDDSIGRTESYAIFDEARTIMKSIDSAAKNVIVEGEGSSRKLSFSISDGVYITNSLDDEIKFKYNGDDDIISTGLSVDGPLYIKSYENKTIEIKLNYTGVNIQNDVRWASGSHNIVIKNNGTESGKTNLVFDVL